MATEPNKFQNNTADVIKSFYQGDVKVSHQQLRTGTPFYVIKHEKNKTYHWYQRDVRLALFAVFSYERIDCFLFAVIKATPVSDRSFKRYHTH